jgi:hypothetical protein
MKRRATLAAGALLLPLLAACDWVLGPDPRPTISNLRLTDVSRLTIDSGDTFLLLEYLIDFRDGDGDITDVVTGEPGKNSVPFPTDQANGRVEGTLRVMQAVHATPGQPSTFTVSVRDSKDHESNVLTGTAGP